MNSFMHGFLDELEKVGGLKRLSRIARSIARKSQDLYAGGPEETGRHRALEGAIAKRRRRAFQHPGGEEEYGKLYERKGPSKVFKFRERKGGSGEGGSLIQRAEAAMAERMAKGTKHPKFRKS